MTLGALLALEAGIAGHLVSRGSEPHRIEPAEAGVAARDPGAIVLQALELATVDRLPAALRLAVALFGLPVHVTAPRLPLQAQPPPEALQRVIRLARVSRGDIRDRAQPLDVGTAQVLLVMVAGPEQIVAWRCAVLRRAV